MKTLTYSSSESSILNMARANLFVANYMKGAQEKRRGFYQFDFSSDPDKAKAELLQIATHVRKRLNSKKVYRVPLVGEATTHYMYIPAFSMKNAQYRAGLVSQGFTVGEPVCLG